MNQEITKIIFCELCGQKLRIPAKLNLQVECPTCGEVATHYQVDIDYRVVQFVCSETGQRFKVLFARNAEEERYRIKAISQEDVLTVTPYSQALYAVASDQSFDIKEFDTSGWYCGVCEWGRDHPVDTTFVRCGRCGQLVCGRRSYTADGKDHFRCYEACGGAGIIEREGPTIASLQGEAFQRKPPEVESGFGDQQLNPAPPLRMLLPKKR